MRRLAAYVRRAEFATIRQAGHFLDLEGASQQEQVRAAGPGFSSPTSARARHATPPDETLAPLGHCRRCRSGVHRPRRAGARGSFNQAAQAGKCGARGHDARRRDEAGVHPGGAHPGRR
ncbi:hypothetical protein BMMON3_23880 [Burkholderia mallei]